MPSQTRFSAHLERTNRKIYSSIYIPLRPLLFLDLFPRCAHELEFDVPVGIENVHSLRDSLEFLVAKYSICVGSIVHPLADPDVVAVLLDIGGRLVSRETRGRGRR